MNIDGEARFKKFAGFLVKDADHPLGQLFAEQKTE